MATNEGAQSGRGGGGFVSKRAFTLGRFSTMMVQIPIAVPQGTLRQVRAATTMQKVGRRCWLRLRPVK